MKKYLLMLGLMLCVSANLVQAREVAVLLPISGPLTPLEVTELSNQVITELSARYVLKHGVEVDKVVKQAFLEESKKNNCDEVNCYRKIASNYKAEYIVAIRVNKIESERYLLTFNLYNVLTNTMASSQQKECMQCTFDRVKFTMGEMLKQINH